MVGLVKKNLVIGFLNRWASIPAWKAACASNGMGVGTSETRISKTELFYKNFMIYIKAFIKGFFDSFRWFFDPSTISGLICNFIFYIFVAINLLLQSNILLSIGFICGALNGILCYLFNTRKKDFIWLIVGLINTIIMFGILLAYFIIYVI